MNPLAWLAAAAAAWVLAAIVVLAGRGSRAAIRVCCVLSAAGGAAALAGGVSALLWGGSRVFTAGAGEVAGSLQLQATSLAEVFACSCRRPAWPGCSRRCSAWSRSASPRTFPVMTRPAAAPGCTWPSTTWR
ncbi:MAG: hypothetical protein ABR926_20080 [Streptosporangiaceae bacterium]